MTILFTICRKSIALAGSPIRKSADLYLFAAPRSLSQLVTSFFGSWCQGILHVLLFAWPIKRLQRSLVYSVLLNYVSKFFGYVILQLPFVYLLYTRVLSEKTWFFLTLLFIQFSNNTSTKMVEKYTVEKTFNSLRCIDHRIVNPFLELTCSLERRWSSRTFRYGYLVTTSP